jgi:putative FmdB family regulatory protein
MPLYEYTCASCEARFEFLQRVGEGAKGVSCPECGGKRVERRLSTFATASSGGGAMEVAESSCGRSECGGGFCAGSAGADWN